MPSLPTGTVTFLFTDIEGSTQRWEDQRVAMAAALALHNAIVRSAVEAHDGFVFKTVGDAFHIAFGDAERALDAAAELQRALDAEPWTAIAPGFAPLKVRAAIHTGPAELCDGDYVGQHVNRTARLIAVTHPGQILFTLATRERVGARLPSAVTLRDHGQYRLRDIRTPEHIFQAVVAGLPDVDLPPAAPRWPVGATGVGAAGIGGVSVGGADGTIGTAADARAGTVDVTAEAVEHALKRLRQPTRSLAGSALCRLACVRERVRAVGGALRGPNLAVALGELLADTITAELGRLRGAPIDLLGVSAADETARLRSDFGAGNRLREAWSVLYHRFISAALPLSTDDIERLAPSSKRTVHRRGLLGYDALARLLARAEAEAQARARPESIVEEDEDGGGGDDARSTVERAHLLRYAESRVAQWSQPHYALHVRCVQLTLLVDQGEATTSGRWRAEPRAFESLADVLAAAGTPALVVLGPPGGGKSTLLRRLELETALDVLNGRSDRVPLFVPLNEYAAPNADAEPASPWAWLSERWRLRNPDLPGLDALRGAGRLLLLLDGLNEMPHRDDADYHARLGEWKRCLHAELCTHPGNRVVFSCRSLDYSAPLSTPALRVAQVLVTPMSDAQVRRFLAVYSPSLADGIWDAITRSAERDLFRNPYLLRLLVEHVEAGGAVADDLPALLTTWVREALRRELERDNPRFAPGDVLARRDAQRIVDPRPWPSPYALPESGALVGDIAAFAAELQSGWAAREPAQVRVAYDDALRVMAGGRPRAEAVLRAAIDLGILDEDRASDSVLFDHQLLQEYFAARAFARSPDLAALRVPVRADEIAPDLAATIASLAPADPLPPAPETAWANTALMAAVMSGNPDGFVSAVADVNLALAGRCAALRACAVAEPVKDALRWRLVALSRDEAVDLRARIAAGNALGALGDPRFTRGTGPDGDYLLPPFIDVPAGEYTIGSDGSIYPEEAPEHRVKIAAFKMAQFPVTRAEWALFMAAGGYEDERWWDTAAGRAWRRGEGTSEGVRANVRDVLARYRAEPGLLDDQRRRGLMSDERHEAWSQRLALSDEGLAAYLRASYPDERRAQPQWWEEEPAGAGMLPVVGITWYEARAYGVWLGCQTAHAVRLATEVEWEAAARGASGRIYPFGNRFDVACCNSVESHVRATTPVGVFPCGDSPEGLADLSGNVFEWVTTASYRVYSYPYREDDGREQLDSAAEVHRTIRGGSWTYDATDARAVCRFGLHPATPSRSAGTRIVSSVG